MIRTTGYDFFCELMLYGNYTEKELWFLLFFKLAALLVAFILVFLMEVFWNDDGGKKMSKNYPEENLENLEGSLEESLEGTLEESVEESTEENTAKNIEEGIEESTDEIIEEPLDEDMEAEDLSCAEDEDRIFILDKNGKSVEVEVEDDVTDD